MILTCVFFFIGSLINENFQKKFKREIFTFKKGANFLPAGNPSLLRVLAKRRLQQKQGYAAGEEEEYIRDEEHPWTKSKVAPHKLFVLIDSTVLLIQGYHTDTGQSRGRSALAYFASNL